MKINSIRGTCVALTRNSTGQVEVTVEAEHADQRKETLLLRTGHLVSPRGLAELKGAEDLLHQKCNVWLDVVFHVHNHHIVFVQIASSDRSLANVRLAHQLDTESIDYNI
jgi:hypothetical protein